MGEECCKCFWGVWVWTGAEARATEQGSDPVCSHVGVTMGSTISTFLVSNRSCVTNDIVQPKTNSQENICNLAGSLEGKEKDH